MAVAGMLPALMMAAFRLRVVLEAPLEEGLHARVAAPLGAGQDVNSAALDHLPGAGAYPSADERVHAVVEQDLDQSAVGEPSVPHDAGGHDLPALHVVYLEVLRPSEVLEHLSVVVADSDSHVIGRQFVGRIKNMSQGKGLFRGVNPPAWTEAAV